MLELIPIAFSNRWGETPVALIVALAKEEVDVDALKDWANSHLGKQ